MKISAYAVTIVAMLLVAGCFDDGGASKDQRRNQTNSEWRVSPEFVDCSGQVMVLEVMPGPVSARLPPGYVLTGMTDAFADVNLEILRCRAVILDNETVLNDVGLASTLAFVTAPPGLDAPGAVDVYVLEFVTDSAGLALKLSQFGMHLDIGSLRVANEAGHVSAQVIVPGKLDYAATALVTDGEQRGADNLQRKQHFGETPTFSFWENSTYHGVGQYVKAVQVNVEGGLLQESSIGKAGQVEGFSDAVYFSGTYDFQEHDSGK